MVLWILWCKCAPILRCVAITISYALASSVVFIACSKLFIYFRIAFIVSVSLLEAIVHLVQQTPSALFPCHLWWSVFYFLVLCMNDLNVHVYVCGCGCFSLCGHRATRLRFDSVGSCATTIYIIHKVDCIKTIIGK